MTDETIVAVYDHPEHAALVVRDLEAAGVPRAPSASTPGCGTRQASTTTAAPAREQGFWASLFGGEPEYEHDTTVYDRSLHGGSTVVTVKAAEQHLTQVMDILERHNPVDMDERAASYGLSSGHDGDDPDHRPHTAASRCTPAQRRRCLQGRRGSYALAEEQLSVGKRLVNRGTTRIRRFVVETPVEEAVTLHSEHVSVERRPVAAGTKVTRCQLHRPHHRSHRDGRGSRGRRRQRGSRKKWWSTRRR